MVATRAPPTTTLDGGGPALPRHGGKDHAAAPDTLQGRPPIVRGPSWRSSLYRQARSSVQQHLSRQRDVLRQGLVPPKPPCPPPPPPCFAGLRSRRRRPPYLVGQVQRGTPQVSFATPFEGTVKHMRAQAPSTKLPHMGRGRPPRSWSRAK